MTPFQPSPIVALSVHHKGRPVPIQTFRNEVFLVREIFEQHEYGILAPRGREGPRRVLDVGANVGLFAVYTKLKYPESIVHCYEPAPGTLPLCEANTRAYAGVTIHPYGLFNCDRPATLHLHGHNTGQNSIRYHVETDESAPIALKDAGGEWDRLGWDAADILKIDTEGCEVEILESLGPRLTLIDYVLVEHHGDEDRRRIDALLSDFELFASRLYAVGTGTAKYIRRSLVTGHDRKRHWPDELAGPEPPRGPDAAEPV